MDSAHVLLPIFCQFCHFCLILVHISKMSHSNCQNVHKTETPLINCKSEGWEWPSHGLGAGDCVHDGEGIGKFSAPWKVLVQSQVLQDRWTPLRRVATSHGRTTWYTRCAGVDVDTGTMYKLSCCVNQNCTSSCLEFAPSPHPYCLLWMQCNARLVARD